MEVVYKLSERQISWFINGISEKNKTLFKAHCQLFWRAYWSEESGIYSFDGLIDDIRIFNRALSPAEVEALYLFEKAPEPYSDADGDGFYYRDEKRAGIIGLSGERTCQ